MDHSAKFPLKALDKRIWFARNPECEIDAAWFSTEQAAFDHFTDYGKFYVYTEIDEDEGKCRFLNEEFAERRDDTAWEREASEADAFHQFMKESAF